MRNASSRDRRLRIAVLSLVFGLAGPAGAVTITFSEFAVGTVITNQYAGSGVTFAGVSGGAPVIAEDISTPSSPVLSPSPSFTGDFEILMAPGFDYVSFDSGYWDVVGTAQIAVFGPGSVLLALLSNTAIGSETIVISGLGEIERIYFNPGFDPVGAIIDNFFAVPEPSSAVLLGGGLIGLAAGGGGRTSVVAVMSVLNIHPRIEKEGRAAYPTEIKQDE